MLYEHEARKAHMVRLSNRDLPDNSSTCAQLVGCHPAATGLGWAELVASSFFPHCRHMLPGLASFLYCAALDDESYMNLNRGVECILSYGNGFWSTGSACWQPKLPVDRKSLSGDADHGVDVCQVNSKLTFLPLFIGVEGLGDISQRSSEVRANSIRL